MASVFTLRRYHAITCNREEESSIAWQSVAFASQAQTFTALFYAVLHRHRMDWVTGLALEARDIRVIANGREWQLHGRIPVDDVSDMTQMSSSLVPQGRASRCWPAASPPSFWR